MRYDDEDFTAFEKMGRRKRDTSSPREADKRRDKQKRQRRKAKETWNEHD